MPRNLEHRVELAVPIEDPRLRTQVLDVVALCLADNHNAWDLDGDGRWTRRRPTGPEATINAQEQLMRLHAGLAEQTTGLS
jgi:polyphosphate kinase